MNALRHGVVLALAALGFVLEQAGCQVADESQVVIGRRFDAEGNCLERRTAIDVVEGANPDKTCEPVCMVGSSPLVDGGAVFVTAQCPPLPPTFDLSGSDPRCEAALAAFERDDLCLIVGSTNPIPDGGDAGDAGEIGDAESVQDAPVVEEAGADADATVTADADAPVDAADAG